MLLFFIGQADGGLSAHLSVVASVFCGGLLAVVLIQWSYYLCHSRSKRGHVVIFAAAFVQWLLTLLSVLAIWQFLHLPVLSEIEFTTQYPLYSLAMLRERLGVIELFLLVISLCVVWASWHRTDHGWLSQFGQRAGYWTGGVIALFALNAVLNPNPLKAMELHYAHLAVDFTHNLFAPDRADQFVLNRLKLPSMAPKVAADKSTAPNILFFRLEEVSQDHFGLYEDSAPTTPFMNSLKARSPKSFFVYNHHVANAGATDTSTTSLYTGLQPNRSGKEFGQMPMLWDYANAAGYETFMAIPFHLSWGRLDQRWAHTPGGLSIDTLIDAKRSKRPIAYDNSISDEDITALTIDWLKSRDAKEPFLAILNFKLPHSNAEGVNTIGRERLGCPNSLWELSIYHCAIYAVDFEIGRVIKELEDQGLLDETVIIVAPDHGADQLNRHGKSRLYNYYQEVLSIPLAMRIPLQFQHRADKANPKWRGNQNTITQNVDILPTIIDLLGISEGAAIKDLSARLDGKSLFQNLSEDRWVLSMNQNVLRPWSPEGFAFTIGKEYKYIFFDNEDELYDLISDPGETNNLLKTNRSEVIGLYERIKKVVLNSPLTREIYARKFPDSRVYDPLFVHSYTGKNLPTQVGVEIEGSDSRHSRNTAGVLSYGPYVTLKKGFYEFKVTYSATNGGGGEIPGQYELGYVSQNRWSSYKKHEFEPGENNTHSSYLTITAENNDKNWELLTLFNGEGSLEIIQLEVLRFMPESGDEGG